jgi:hypothetical protein
MPSQYETYLRRYLNDNGRLWTSAQIERWAAEAERTLTEAFPTAVERISIPVQNGVPLYEIPTNSLGIVQITYRGEVLVPLSQAQSRELFPDYVIQDYNAANAGAFVTVGFSSTGFAVDDATGYSTYGGTTSRPEFWGFSGYEENTIQLFPTPNETLPATASARLWDTEIPNRCILEYRVIPGATDDLRPVYRLIRMIIRDYVLARAFSIEGKGQQLDVAQHCEKRFQLKLQLYTSMMTGVYVSNNSRMAAQEHAVRWPRTPNFGNIGRIIR